MGRRYLGGCWKVGLLVSVLTGGRLPAQTGEGPAAPPRRPSAARSEEAPRSLVEPGTPSAPDSPGAAPAPSTPSAGRPLPTSGVPRGLTQPGTPGAPEYPSEPRAPTAPTPLLLNRALGLEESPWRVFGWIQNSFTGNANGTPPSRTNFGVYPNHLANQWMGNQYYLAVENPLEANDRINLGFRVDTLFGNDWQFTKAYGLFDRAWHNNWFAGIDLPQLYGEIHLPFLTRGGVDIRGGRFFSLTGFESPQAIARPLLSVPYTLNFTPFTYFGAIATLNVSSRLKLINGTVNGFDRWIDQNDRWGYLGAVTWTSRDERTTLVIGGVNVSDQLPRYPPANSPFLPVGVATPPLLDGRINSFYAQSKRSYIVGVLTHKWGRNEKLTQAVETAHVFDPLILGFGNDPHVAHSAAYHSVVNWFLYHYSEKVTGVWRSEVFWDPYGLATGLPDTYYEMTLGFNTRPKPWLWVRPEARYDWAQFGHPYNDGTRQSQLTLGIDVIILF